MNTLKKYVEPNKLYILLEIFESLLLAEETVVREEAVKKLSPFLASCKEDFIVKRVLPLVIKLYENESFTGKVSACMMIRQIYSKSGKEKENLALLYSKLCDDETPLIKKTAAKELGPLSRVFPQDYVTSDLLSILKKFTTDQDYIQTIALSALVDIIQVVKSSPHQKAVVEIAVTAAGNASWKIRNEIAKLFPFIEEGLGSGFNELVSSYAKLISDGEMEVRLTALQSLNTILKVVPSEIVLNSIVIHVVNLQNESHKDVRVALGLCFGQLVKSLGYAIFNTKLRTLLNAYLSDEVSEVRQATLTSLFDIFEASEGQLFASSSSLLSQLSKDPKWRVRAELVNLIAKLGNLFVGS